MEYILSKTILVAPILVDIKIIPLTLTPGCECPPKSSYDKYHILMYLKTQAEFP